MSLYSEFDHYNAPLGPDGTPFAYYESLRDEALATGTPIGWSEAYGGFWVVTGWQEAKEISHNHQAFSNTGATFPSYGTPGQRPIMLDEYDEPEHKRYRRLMTPPFSPKRAMDVAEELRGVTNELIDEFIDDGRVDVVEGLTNEIPARTIAIILGLPPEHGGSYRKWTDAIARLATTDPAAAKPLLEEFDAYYDELLEDRRRNLGDDVLSMVIQAEIDGVGLTDDEIKDFFVVLLLGGIDNTTKHLANMFWRLAWDPELRRRFVAHPELLSTGGDEFLRYYSPALAGRLAKERIEVGGVTIEPGQQLLMVNPILNRDPREFDNPDAFIPERTPNRHFGLGLGIHRCLGAHLVRVETQVCAEEFFKRIPEWELDPTRKAKWIRGQVAGMGEVPIVFPEGGGAADDAWTPAVGAQVT